jgi:hypothetical protein
MAAFVLVWVIPLLKRLSDYVPYGILENVHPIQDCVDIIRHQTIAAETSIHVSYQTRTKLIKPPLREYGDPYNGKHTLSVARS